MLFNLHKMSLFIQSALRKKVSVSLTQKNTDNAISHEPQKQNTINHDKMRVNVGKHDSTMLSDMINSVSHINLSSPPGLAGAICEDIELFEHRELPALRPLVALTAMSFLARHIQSFGGGNLRFFALGIALSASGKEAHQTYLKLVMKSAELSSKIAGKPRSDKNIYLDVVDFEETMYLVDEVHSFFQQATSASAASFESGMISVLLELSTSESFVFPSKILNELKAQYEQELERLEGKPNASQKDVERVVRILGRLSVGWDEPYVQFTGYSTPINMKNIYNKKNIEQGLIARIITLLGPDKRGLFTGRKIEHPSVHVLARLQGLSDKNAPLTISDKAECYLASLTDFFERDDVLNHPHLGALYARGRKTVLLISSILAVENGQITIEYLKYAFAFFLNNVQSCEKFYMSNTAKVADVYSEAQRVAEKQLAKVNLTTAQLANKMTLCSKLIKEGRKSQPRLCYELIERLCSDGLISVTDNSVYLRKQD